MRRAASLAEEADAARRREAEDAEWRGRWPRERLPRRSRTRPASIAGERGDDRQQLLAALQLSREASASAVADDPDEGIDVVLAASLAAEDADAARRREAEDAELARALAESCEAQRRATRRAAWRLSYACGGAGAPARGAPAPGRRARAPARERSQMGRTSLARRMRYRARATNQNLQNCRRGSQGHARCRRRPRHTYRPPSAAAVKERVSVLLELVISSRRRRALAAPPSTPSRAHGWAGRGASVRQSHAPMRPPFSPCAASRSNVTRMRPRTESSLRTRCRPAAPPGRRGHFRSRLFLKRRPSWSARPEVASCASGPSPL